MSESPLRFARHPAGFILQYREQVPDWSAHNEKPDMRWTEWQDVPVESEGEETVTPKERDR